MDLSDDGEIKDDEFSDISEEEYFDTIANKIEKRKLELELLNQIEIVAYDDYAKENRYENSHQHRNRHSNLRDPARSSSNTNVRKEKPRKTSEIRNRSYRAPSIFSKPNHILAKRKRQRRKKKYNRPPSPVVQLSSSSSGEEIIVNHIKNDLPESDEDEELLALRLQALTSKQEVKELIDDEPPNDEIIADPIVIPPVEMVHNEEELLRIAALRSAIIKKKDHFRKRKQQMKMENERPYSPSDNFQPFIDAVDLSNSPLGSPFHETNHNDINNEDVDMDISSSPDENSRDACEILVTSPQPKSVPEISPENEDENEDELRSMLLSSIGDRKKDNEKEKISENELDELSAPSSPSTVIAKNLKLAVERLRQQKQQVAVPIVSQKSGTKTIKMILEEQKNKKLIREEAQTSHKEAVIESSVAKGIIESEIAGSNSTKNLTEIEQSEALLIEKISTDQMLPPVDITAEVTQSASVEIADSFFSTITDTKNIPILPEAKKIDNRLVTSLDSVMRPVTPIVISLGAESSEDEYDRRAEKSRKKDMQPKNNFEKDLDNFLKNIRTQHEKSEVTKTGSSNLKLTKSQTSPKTSAVKHLPLSSQIEYEKLLQKMKTLQEAKQQRQKEGTLKRTKSTSSANDQPNSTTSTLTSSESLVRKKQAKSPEKKVVQKESTIAKEPVAKTSKIDDALSKIPLLDEAARLRLIEKTENNFLNHSKNLLDSTETNVKLLDENALEVKRREKIESKIDELEKTLAKYKNLLRVVNTRIKSNTPKILQSQRDMIKLRNHQQKFGQICKKVGETVCGKSYKLPNYEASTITNNFIKISENTEIVQQQATNDQPYASKQLKLLSEKVKEFAQEPKIVEEKVKEPENSGRAIIRSVSQLIATCDNEEEPVMADEKDNPVESTIVDVNVSELNFPEIHRHVKRILESKDVNEPAAKKQIMRYESPLEFLKLPPSIIGDRKSVNQIVCPFAMEGTCNDTECKYLHL